VSIFIFVAIMTYILNKEKNKELNRDIKRLEQNYLSQNKAQVKNLVDKFYKLIELETQVEKENFNNEIKKEIYHAHSLATAIYNENIKKSNYSKEETIESIKSALRAIRFNENGYLFIFEMNGKNILNSEFANIENKNLWEYQDSKGKFIFKDMNKLLSNANEGYYDWYWKKNKNDEKEYSKIGFLKRFEPYDLYIGTGYYEDDYEKKAKLSILKKINSFALNDSENIFIYDLNGLCLIHPKKELIGTNRYSVKNEDGKYNVKDNIDFIKENKEGFVEYNSTVKLNESLKSNYKISFLKLNENWGWMIGSSFYLEQLYDDIEQRKLDLISDTNLLNQTRITIISLITIIILIISLSLSKVINNIFNRYKLRIDDEMKQAMEKERLLIQQSKMATMGEMIGSIAHQWKQPLSVILMSNGVLKLNREIKDFSTEAEIDDSIKNIDNSVHNLSQTIDDFRNFFNPNKEKVIFNILEAFEDTFKLINSQFKNNNIEIIKDIKDVEILGFKNELLQVLINLLKNSKEILSIKSNLERKLIFINVDKIENEVIIKIKDNGNGISNDNIDKIFEAYFTTKEKEGGTGIGLYICKQIIEHSMKGKIEVSNVEYEYEKEVYKGAEFTIEINVKN
jgi:two-component system, NtrC family, sensor kinase